MQALAGISYSCPMKTRIIKLLILPATAFTFSACIRTELNKENDSVNKAQTYSLVEHRQRVIRYNCQNQVISDQIESVKTPIEHLSIHPNDSAQLYSSRFENRSLNTSAGSIVNYTDFTIDLNPGLLNLEVQVGSNHIHYEFYYCTRLLPAPHQGQCAHTPELREAGSIFINVTYEKIDLSGESIVKPAPEDCLRPKLNDSVE